MKRLFSIALAVLAVSGHAAYAQEIESLSAVSRNTASYLETRLSKGAKLLLLPIIAPAEAKALAEYLTGDLSTILVNSKYFTMVDRDGITRDEMMYQLSGEVSDETAQSLGQQTGAEITVWGSFELLGAFYRLNVKAISVKTAEIQAQRAVFLQSDQFLTSLLNQRQEATQPTQPAQPLWITEPYKYGRLKFEGGSAGGVSPWYYDFGVSNMAASEQLARNRARQNVQANIAENIASDMKARIDLTEFSLFMTGNIEDAERRIESAITTAIRTKVPRYELLEWHIESGKNDAGKTWYVARVLVRLPRQEIISVVENLDYVRIASTVTDAVLPEATPDVKAEAADVVQVQVEKARDYELEELHDPVDTLEADMERVRDYAREEARGQ